MTVHLLRIDTPTAAEAAELWAAFPKRAAAAARLRQEADRRRALAGTWLLRHALGLEDETLLRDGPQGKPGAEGFPPFSLSHSGDWAMLALGEAELGADLEAVAPRRLGALRRLCTPEEAAWAGDSPARFFQLWTWKEAVMKATGLGLALSPRKLCVLPFTEGQPVEAAGGRWHSVPVQAPEGYALGLCSARPGETADIRDWSGAILLAELKYDG